MRTVPAPPPATDDLDAPRLVLRDGTVASVRTAAAADRDELRRFFRDLSAESRWKRFFTLGEPSQTVIDRATGSSEDGRALTLVACRHQGGDDRIIAVASYIGLTDAAAEVAFAVDDRFQGKGISTLLLERLAAHAAAHGFRQFHATTLGENVAMREVFRDSGFEIRSRSAEGTVDVQLSLTPTAEGVATAERRRRLATAASLRPMLIPRAVAVIGASREPGKMGGRILQALTVGGFLGPVYPVNPSAAEIAGRPAFRSARELPADVDLAVIAVPPDAVLSAVDDCAAAGVKALVVITAGFAETGGEGRTRQNALVEKARGYGMRVLARENAPTRGPSVTPRG